MKPPRALLGLSVLLAATSCSSRPDPEIAGRLRDTAIDEASGIAASNVARDRFWVHNDSGGEPVLYSITSSGVPEGRVRIAGVENHDWEDVAAFDLDGKHYVLAADVGDNNAVRHNCQLIIIEEPDPASVRPGVELTLPPAWVIPVRYPEGPLDCESVAVDPKERAVYLIAKRKMPPVLYRLPLDRPSSPESLVAQRLGVIPKLPQPSLVERFIPGPRQSFRAEPTAMDISRDGTKALVLTYGELSLFVRRSGESWAAVLGRKPDLVLNHDLPQAEGACFSLDGTRTFAVSEGRDEPVVRWDVSSLK